MSKTPGTGKILFGGVDITAPPYYAHLADAAKYWWLDGFDSMQFPTSPLSLISTRPYLKDWVISVVLRPKVPDNTRESMVASLVALSELFDPTKGEQQLIFAEYLGSYFMAKRQSSNLANENITPTLVDIDIDFACTGPAYSTTTRDVNVAITNRNTEFTLTSEGDTLAYPRWRIYAGANGAIGFSISNETTGEQIEWSDTLNFGDYVDFIMDAEYGTPGTILINGVTTSSTFTGPAWPHVAPGTNQILFQQTVGLHDCLIQVTWRDRFKVGLRIPQTPITPPPYQKPVHLTIGGSDTPSSAGSYILSGTLLDVYLNPVPNATVTIQSNTPVGNWAPGAWSNLGTATTDSNGVWTLPPTSIISHRLEFRAYYKGDATHTSTYSSVLRATPPASRLNSTLTINVTNIDPVYTFSGVFKDSTGTPVENIPVYLYISEDSINYETHLNNDYTDFYRLDPYVDNPVFTDINGNYSFTTTLGTASPYSAGTTMFFDAYSPGNLSVNGSNSPWQTIIENALYPPQLPQPIQYMVMLDPPAINNGLIQYFAANGFTICILIAPAGSTAKNYAAELAIIKALGMTPILDIEMIVGSLWNSGTFSVFTPYFEQMAAAGWTTVASEVGWHTGAGTTLDCVAFARQYFDGYVNFHVNEANMTVTTSPYKYRGIYIDPGTTADVWESYYDDMAYRAIFPGTDAAAALGIPCGILAGAWAADWNAIWQNSLAGTTPGTPYINAAGETTTTGNTYQSLIEWSYTAGVGFSFFGIDMYSGSVSPNQSIQNYLDMGFPDIVTTLQQEFPPSGTDALIPPTILAANMSLSITQDSDGTYSFSGNLTELVSGNAITAEAVTLLSSPDNSTWTEVTGTTPATTDSNGNFSWTEVELSAGTYYIQAYYAGDATHLPFYGPIGNPAVGVKVVVNTGTTPTSITLSASNMAPLTGVPETLTANLISGATALETESVTILLTDSSGATFATSTGESDVNGNYQYTLDLTTSGVFSCTASFAGSSEYQSSSSIPLSLNVIAAQTILQLTVDNDEPVLDDTINFTANLSNAGVALAGETVTIWYYIGTSGTEYPATSGTTDADGNLAYPATLSAGGEFTYYASFAGDGVYPAVTSDAVPITVMEYEDSITLTANNSSIVVTQPITFTVNLMSGTTPLSSQSVTIYHYFNGLETTDTTGTTDANGNFTYTTSYATLGAYTFYASFAGVDDTYPAVTSSVLPIAVTSNTAITLSVDNPTPTTAQTINFTATLLSNGVTPIPSESVTIYHYISPDTTTQITDTTATTNSSGVITFSVDIGTVTTNDYYAVFGGDATYQEATSNEIIVTVSQSLTYLSKAGVFTTSTGNQAVTVGFEPIAVIFWWTPQAQQSGWYGDSQIGYGFAANSSPITSGYVSCAGNNGQTTSAEERRYSSSAAIGLVNYSGTLLAEATVTFTDGNSPSTGFTLDWTTAPGAWALNYLVLGGTGYTNAAVVPWTASTSAGVQTVTSSLGFTPGCVITIGDTDTAASPHSTTDAVYTIGALDANGNEWSKSGYARNGLTTTATKRVQLTDSHIVGLNESTGVIYYKGTGAIISGGFTVDWLTGLVPPSALKFMSLCLGGGAYQVGAWAKSATVTPPTQTDTITTTGMTPVAVLMTTDSYPASASVQNGHRLSIGGCAGGANIGVLVTDKNAVTTTVVYKYDNSYNSIQIADTDTEANGAYGYAGTFTLGSFQFSWSLNNTTATQICYIAFGY